MKRAADIAKNTELYNINNMDNSKLWGDEKLMYDEFKDRIYIKHLYGPLFFGFTSHFQK
jgi:SulP family sulfate permease